MADKKTLIYCTNGYPSDVFSEKVFVDGELTALRRHFDRIILLPDADAGRRLGFADTLPERIRVSSSPSICSIHTWRGPCSTSPARRGPPASGSKG